MATKLMTESSHPLTNLKSLRFITSPEGEPQSVIISIDEFASLMETLKFKRKRISWHRSTGHVKNSAELTHL